MTTRADKKQGYGDVPPPSDPGRVRSNSGGRGRKPWTPRGSASTEFPAARHLSAPPGSGLGGPEIPFRSPSHSPAQIVLTATRRTKSFGPIKGRTSMLTFPPGSHPPCIIVFPQTPTSLSRSCPLRGPTAAHTSHPWRRLATRSSPPTARLCGPLLRLRTTMHTAMGPLPDAEERFRATRASTYCAYISALRSGVP